MDRLLEFCFRQFVRRGTLKVTLANGRRLAFGDGTGQAVAIRLTTPAAQRHLLLDPELAFGEVYTDGTLVVEEVTIDSQSGVATPLPGGSCHRPNDNILADGFEGFF